MYYKNRMYNKILYIIQILYIKIMYWDLNKMIYKSFFYKINILFYLHKLVL